MNDLPRYRSHKEVNAAKIDVITPNDNGSTSLVCGTATISVSREYVDKHGPQVGGYYVLYEDGYESWSPAEAFESGYTRI